jgi:hypothetical protein
VVYTLSCAHAPFKVKTAPRVSWRKRQKNRSLQHADNYDLGTKYRLFWLTAFFLSSKYHSIEDDQRGCYVYEFVFGSIRFS